MRGRGRIVAFALGLLFIAGPAVARASVWSVQPLPGLPNTFDELGAVSCAAVDQCVAVGGQSYYAPTAPFAAVFEGSRWTPEDASVGFDDDGSALVSVSCPAYDDCIAVGYDTILGLGSFPIAERWDGEGWSGGATIPDDSGPPPEEVLDSVSCSSPTMCVAVGYNAGLGEPLVERFDGTTWTREATPAVGDGGILQGVSCVRSGACTAVGGGLIERFAGRGWSIETPALPPGGGPPSLDAVTCLTARLCTAVGQANGVPDGSVPFAERRGLDGRWRVESVPVPATSASASFNLTGVDCTPVGCAAVGGSETGSPALVEVKPLFGPWRVVPSGAADGTLEGVSCGALIRCEAVGEAETADGTGSSLAEAGSLLASR